MVIAVFSIILIVIGLIDLKTKLVYGVIIWPAIIAALLVSIFTVPSGIVNSLAGAASGSVILLIPYLITKGKGLGVGDIEIVILIGLLVGYYEVVVAIVVAVMLGSLVAVAVRKRKVIIPFGPYLSAGGIISILWGVQIIESCTKYIRT